MSDEDRCVAEIEQAEALLRAGHPDVDGLTQAAADWRAELEMIRILKAPFPWFGGKSRVAHLVWDRFGNVENYVEPFAGSLAVLLARPHAPQTETVNDADCYLANFWRALRAGPEQVAEWADWPVNEADLHARHLWLVNQADFRERMKTDPDFCDAKIAGWWVWGLSAWIGGSWCAPKPELDRADGSPRRGRPFLSTDGQGINAGMGVIRRLPHLGDAGRGGDPASAALGRCGETPDKRPHLSGRGNGVGVHSDRLSPRLPKIGDRGGIHVSRQALNDFTGSDAVHDVNRRSNLMLYFQALAERLRRVRVCCGDWTRVTGPSVTIKHGICGVFLDPPYSAESGRSDNLYGTEDLEVAHAVRAWALESGDNPLLRIALCGYEGEHAMPSTWECVAWKNRGGYGSQGHGRGAENAHRERIWFSKYCIRPTLFGQEGF